MRNIALQFRFILFAFCCVVFGSVTLAQSSGELVTVKSKKSIVKNYAPSGEQGFVLMDISSGRILESMNAEKALPPASVAKVMTTIYALRNLGSDWQFQTRLIGESASVVNGVLQGDLTLVGGGDPQLDTDGLARLIASLKVRGVNSISGDFKVYAKALPYQKVLDVDQLDHVGYNPAISGLNLNFNRVFFEWKAEGGGYNFTFSAKTKALKPLVSGVEMKAVNRKEPLYGYSSKAGRESWTVSAKALGGKGNRWLPVRTPANYAAEVFRTLAASQGVLLPKANGTDKIPSGVVLANDKSAPLISLTRSMLKYSTNLTAETVGLSASIKRGSTIRKVSESGRAMGDWLRGRYGVRSVRMQDHSGLNDASKVSAADMARLLQIEGWNGPLRPLLKKVDLRNENWKKAPISGTSVVAKTGTLILHRL